MYVVVTGWLLLTGLEARQAVLLKRLARGRLTREESARTGWCRVRQPAWQAVRAEG